MILYVLNFSVFGNYRVMLQKASKNAILYSKETKLGLDSIMVNGQYSLLYFISKVYTKCDTIHRFNENILKCSRLLNFPSFENKSIEHTWKKMMEIYLFKRNLIAIIILNIGIPNVLFALYMWPILILLKLHTWTTGLVFANLYIFWVT